MEEQEDAGGGGEGETRQVGGGAYVERLGGPEEVGWGVRGGTVGASPERQGGRAEEKRDRGVAGQVVSSQHCSPASRCRHSPPLPHTDAAWGIIECPCPAPSPLPLGGRGRGRVSHQLGEGGGGVGK